MSIISLRDRLTGDIVTISSTEESTIHVRDELTGELTAIDLIPTSSGGSGGGGIGGSGTTGQFGVFSNPTTLTSQTIELDDVGTNAGLTNRVPFVGAGGELNTNENFFFDGESLIVDADSVSGIGIGGNAIGGNATAIAGSAVTDNTIGVLGVASSSNSTAVRGSASGAGSVAIDAIAPTATSTALRVAGHSDYSNETVTTNPTANTARLYNKGGNAWTRFTYRDSTGVARHLAGIQTEGTANQVLRVPNAGGEPTYGQVNLASSDAVTGALAKANQNTATAYTDQENTFNSSQRINGILFATRVSEDPPNSALSSFVLQRNIAGTPVSGFGNAMIMRAKSSTTENRDLGYIAGSWINATDASRTSRLSFIVYNVTTQVEALRMEPSGTNPAIGFLGANSVPRQVVTGSRGGNAALASLLTGLANLGLITDNTTA